MCDNPLEDLLRKHLPITKNTKGGWEKFDAPCCTHNGEGRDKRSRGNIIFSQSGISYNCYNCQYRASWKGGSPIVGKKMADLLLWLGASKDEIREMKCKMRVKFQGNEKPYVHKPKYVNFDFNEMDLPEKAKPIDYWLSQNTFDDNFLDMISYLYSRGDRLLQQNFYWSPLEKYSRKIIIPFYWDKEIVGYALRAIDKDFNPRYLNYKPKSFIYNTESIKDNNKIIIVVEGVFDALSINGVALLGANITDEQVCWLNQQNKTIILFSDNDSNGGKLKNVAEKNHWYFINKLRGYEHLKDASDIVKEIGAAATVSKLLSQITTRNI